ncbi:lysylphosphatidylglycerol synthase transmembrane domain-containing protein [uncultured Thiothrix sp.]|uniref:lysylphosphatidylglycerol synthase transmembrane domain-containing protein n=1 Tax=uncultured Thiothrix sp. TaxID=223185 RepID=UPI00262B37B1|nr:lysylphosphatidylglycerol synthase transmembrane domain-containing protein [uncultured Thiothrix sp.]HMT91941.1 lysylphosphatidylglycerol synthase transmembrane domain-containing protein [Thiolinea sp.]
MTETKQLPPPTHTSVLPNWLNKTLPWLILLLFIAGVEYWLGWKTILQPWAVLSWQQLSIAMALLLISYGLRTWRLYDYFSSLRPYPVASLRLTLLHNFFNNLLPARTGELSFPMMMKRYFDINYAQSVSALLWFRFLDLHCILAFAIYPLLVVTPLRRLAIPIILLWMLIPPLVYLLRNKVELHFVGKDGRLSELAQKMLFGLPNTVMGFLKSWGLTWLNWLVKLLTLAWVLDQFIDGVTWNVLITAVVAGELTSVLPIHAPAGIGTYEAGIITALLAFLSPAVATSAAINVHLFVLGSAIIGGLVGWLLPKPKTA